MQQSSLLDGLLQHVVTVPARDRNERDLLGVVSDLLDEAGRLLDNFVEAVLTPLQMRSNKYSITSGSDNDVPWWCPSC
jgi:hypothetical protein